MGGHKMFTLFTKEMFFTLFQNEARPIFSGLSNEEIPSWTRPERICVQFVSWRNFYVGMSAFKRNCHLNNTHFSTEISSSSWVFKLTSHHGRRVCCVVSSFLLFYNSTYLNNFDVTKRLSIYVVTIQTTYRLLWQVFFNAFFTFSRNFCSWVTCNLRFLFEMLDFYFKSVQFKLS